MKPSSIIAKRYLFSKKRISLITTLTLISISGVTIGTALLIIVLSVFNGFFDLVKEMLIAYDPDIRIESTEGARFLYTAEMQSFIEDHPEIRMVSPFAEGKALIAHRGDTYKVAQIRGVRTERFSEMVNLRTEFFREEFDLSLQHGSPGMLMGRSLMGQLGLSHGSTVSLISAQSIQRSLTQFSGPRTFSFEIRGSYSMDEMYDGSVIFVELEAAQRLFNMRSAISGIDIDLVVHENADAMQRELQAFLGDDFMVRTWYDLQRPLYDVMNLEKWGAFIILMIIVLVAVLNIVGSLTMIVIQKTKDIALLRSIGYKTSQIKQIFLKQGVYIGLIGCLLGGGVGLLVCWLQDTYGFVKLAGAESFIIDAYPVDVIWTDVALVLTGSLILCILASWYPARRAASVEISSALRYE